MSHSSISSSLTQPVPPCKFHILPLCELYFLLPATRLHLCIFLHLLSTTGMSLCSFWRVLVLYPKYRFQHFRVVRWAMHTRFHSNLLISLQVFLLFILFLSASLSLPPVILSFTFVLYPPNFCMDNISSWFPPISSIPSRLRDSIVFQLALSLLSPTQPYQLWLAVSFWHVPYFILPFQLSHVSSCFKWVHSQVCSESF